MSQILGVRSSAIALACLASARLLAAGFPSTEISNAQLRLTIYLPDARNGFYRASRFDWSGVIGDLEYKGHRYYGPWFSRVDPNVHDYTYEGEQVTASPCSAGTGPVEEFQTNGSALGWDEAKPGGTFIKIGVGVLRKDDKPYDFVRLYPVVDSGKWSVSKQADFVEFEQQLDDPAAGYGYAYRKVVRLIPGKPEMVLEHNLRNTGRRTIESTVYNHNFLVLDGQAPGPDFEISVPYQIQHGPRGRGPVEVRGNRIVYLKQIEGHEVGAISAPGFSASPSDNDIHIENRKVGAGMRITGDRPLANLSLWSIKTTLAVEPTIRMKIEPGGEFQWRISYTYYVK
ncbi:MAG TPA: hypothetical protein VMT86_06100 [Bryobacteraceae bacterium]|nr:hypothetical protein [Bryobacteraceae bacterium]